MPLIAPHFQLSLHFQLLSFFHLCCHTCGFAHRFNHRPIWHSAGYKTSQVFIFPTQAPSEASAHRYNLPSVDFLLFVSLVYLLFILFAYTAPDEEKEDSYALIHDKGKDNTKEGLEDEVEQADLAKSMPVCCGLSVGFLLLPSHSLCCGVFSNRTKGLYGCMRHLWPS